MFRSSVIIKIGSAMLMLLMLISSIGLSINIHYCGDAIKAIGVFTQAPSCEMMDGTNCNDESSCSEHQSIETKCCSYDAIYNKLSPEVSVDLGTVDHVLHEAPFVSIVSNDLRKFEVIKPGFYSSDKVPKVKDNTVMYQCFLI